MKRKSLGLAVLSAMAFMAFASTASATTLQVTGVTQAGAVTIEASLAPGMTSQWTTTSKAVLLNGCTSSTVDGTTTSFTGATVGGTVGTLSWSGCSEGNPTVDAAGTFTIERIGTTSNGTVRSSGTKTTVPSVFGTLTCTTSTTDIGQLTGVDSGSATLDISAVINCGIIASARWEGTYTITSPHALTVVA